MRTIVCRFQDSEELHRHIVQNTNTEVPQGVAFLGDFNIKDKERVKLIVIVDAYDERCTLEANVRSHPSTSTDAMSAFEGLIEGADRVWFEMFLSKMHTMNQFRSMHPDSAAA